jgi:hypothetical protein
MSFGRLGSLGRGFSRLGANGGAPAAAVDAWWNADALYDFDFVNQRGRDVAGAANIAVGSFSTYFAFTSGAPSYDADGLQFDNTVNFYKAAFDGVLATLTSGDDVCVLVETTAGGIANSETMLGTGGGGQGDLSRDSATSLGSWNGTNFLSIAIGGGASYATSHIRNIYKQTAAGRRICANGGTVASDAFKSVAGRPYNLGCAGANTAELNGSIRRCIVFDPATVSDADMQSYTTGTTT